ncbi:evasin P1095-like [Ixodes scapularis]|uniref:evasin P1095-like n=1 Tax=Ixodes scapularis TaxID=6945 RepID=UPI001A9EF74A|nr:evasin P1095-like [Ixodes scapularis]
MELKTIIFLQIAAFMVLGIHLLVAGSEVQAEKEFQEDGIYVQYCGKNCTLPNEESTRCSEDCKCVYEGNNSHGICISISILGNYQDLDFNDTELIKATPRPPSN